MAYERREPTLSNPNDKTNTSKRAATGGGSVGNNNPAPARSSARQNVIVKKQPSFLLWLTFLIALATAAGAGYLFWQFTLAQQTLVEQQNRIDELENKLLLTGDESAQSLTVLTANVKGLDKEIKLALSEVDKLWGTRNVNRKAIEEAKVQIDDSDKKVAAMRKKLDAELKKTSQSLARIDEKLAKPVSALQQRSSEQEILLQSLRERVADQGQTLKQLSSSAQKYASKQQLDALNKQIKANDEAVKSIDKFRLAVNRDLLLLKQRAGVQTQ